MTVLNDVIVTVLNDVIVTVLNDVIVTVLNDVIVTVLNDVIVTVLNDVIVTVLNMTIIRVLLHVRSNQAYQRTLKTDRRHIEHVRCMGRGGEGEVQVVELALRGAADAAEEPVPRQKMN